MTEKDHNFGTGAQGSHSEQTPQSHQTVEQIFDAHIGLIEQTGKLFKKAGAVGDFAAKHAMPHAGYEDLRHEDRSLHTSIHDQPK